MKLAIRGIAANLGDYAANTFTDDRHKDLKADFIMANPAFNQDDWRAENQLTDDPRWQGYDTPPTSNAHYGWILNANKKARVVNRQGEEIKYRDREDEILFIDMRQMGEPFEKTYVRFSDDDIRKVADTYHNWQREGHTDTYADVPEFCKSVSVNGTGGVKEKGFSIVPSKYIEFVNRDETVDYETSMRELQSELSCILREEAETRASVLDVFKSLGYEIEL